MVGGLSVCDDNASLNETHFYIRSVQIFLSIIQINKENYVLWNQISELIQNKSACRIKSHVRQDKRNTYNLIIVKVILICKCMHACISFLFMLTIHTYFIGSGVPTNPYSPKKWWAIIFLGYRFDATAFSILSIHFFFRSSSPNISLYINFHSHFHCHRVKCSYCMTKPSQSILPHFVYN